MKILVVEDDPQVQDLYKDVLEMEYGNKIVVLQAFLIAEAEAVWAGHNDIDLVILDGFIEAEGRTTGGFAKKVLERPGVKVIGCSGHHAHQAALSVAGVPIVLKKPVPLADLRAALPKQ